MSRTSPHQRVFAFAGALLFLGTAVASGVIVIWQINQDRKVSQANNAANSQSNTNTQQNGGNKLEGTKLKDFTPVAARVIKLQVIDTVVGTGDTVGPNDTVTAHYTGALASTGVIFQSSLDSGQPFTSSLSGLIKGWQEGIPGMKVGGTRRLIIPAAEAYANQSQPGIPADSDLVFDIQLISVKHQ